MRRVLGVVAGLVTGFVLIYALEFVGHLIYPPPEGFDLKDPDDIARMMDQISLGAMISVVVAWFFGTLGAAFVATRVAQETTMITASIIGAIELTFGIFNFFAIPHPTWMVVAGALAFVMGAWIGGTMGLWRDPDKAADE